MANLSEEQIAELKAGFAIMDTSGDGHLSKEEFKDLFSKIGHPVEDVVIDEMIRVYDVNGDGKIDFNEFLKFV